MNIFAVVVLCIIAAVTAAVLKQFKKEYALIVSLAAVIFVVFWLIGQVTPILNRLYILMSDAGMDGYAGTLMKALGIALLTQLGADSCRDAGESALATKLEIAGRVSILVISLPLLEELCSMAARLIKG